MAARTVQINSFCGGSSRLLDSEFLGMEESLNMYPETVTATDTYTTKMLKGVEGFNQGSLYSQEHFSGFGVVNSNPFGNDSIKESVLVVAQGDDYNIYNTYGGTKTKVGMFTAGGVGTRSVIEEMPNGLALVLCNYKLVVIDPSQAYVEATPPQYSPSLTLPNAFDHAGTIWPSQIAQLNFRIVLNDENCDYIYWSELNRPTDANDTHAFEQNLTQYKYTKADGTQVTWDDNVFYAPAVGTYDPATLETRQTYTSSLNSMKMDFKADSVVALRATDSSLFVFGHNSLEILRWQNSTTAPFAIVAKTSLAGVDFANAVKVIGNECYFVGKGPGGMLGVYAVDESGNVRKISSRSVDQRLARYTGTAGIKDIRTITYSYKGHSFFVVSIFEYYGEFEETFAYDLTEDTWADRATFDERGDRLAWNVFDAIQFEGRPFFATYTKGGNVRLCEFWPSSGTDRYMDEDNLSTAPYYLRKERVTGIKYDGVNDIVATSLELVMNAGATLDTNPNGAAYNPKVMLQVSVDGGRTWSNELWAYAGKVGQYSWRVRWNCLGRGARFAFKVRMADPVQFEIATAYLSYLQCGNRI